MVPHINYAVLYWSPPKDCTAIQGPIEGYTVTLTALSPWVNTTLPMQVVQGIANELYDGILNLIPFTRYRASVFVMGPNGKTNPALPYSVNFTTLADGECQKVKYKIISDFVGMMIKFMMLYLTFVGGHIIPQLCIK
jgi:hypothetical protein